ncbi:DUF2786 domain-containing protein [Actinomycetospora sp. TBRC 11914]|uniref:DUF2786 domain-containing protein n=1 Tax=Actinomycetospora sp. TBRC 11914 TaxID=2729387 RepID=UPI00145EA66E|nr:DUF2786 domain-containing protein [Actinomycetospora sp. TBRC 11914]NMO91976.1 DUF2786 domain-containing protein [Actinomycetospora sp. TBRC 11914]
MTRTTDAEPVAHAAALLTELAVGCSGGEEDVGRVRAVLVGRWADAVLDAAADRALLETVDALWVRGWTPRDAVEVLRRRLGTGVVAPLGDVLAADARRRPATWSLAGVDATVWWDVGSPLVTQWRTGRGLPHGEALGWVVRVVGAARRLPALPAVGPAGDDGAGGADPRILARVRGLLAKAESTSFPEEAEALSAKAQELMARHALERAVVDPAPRGGAASASVRRLWLDAPYTSAKSSLVHQVAGANRCRAVSLAALDLVTVIGWPTDLDTVELLVTSLLVQAGRAMAAEGSRGSRTGGSRTRSFRHAFLLSYATRIGERLREAGATAQEEAVRESDGALLPVLAARGEAVERTTAELFPTITTKRFSVGNAAGWRAGREAADAASLHLGREALE